MSFFVDTFFTKVNTFMYPILLAEGEEQEAQAMKMTEAIKKEIEPLLADAGPFFGGSKTMTLADVRCSFWLKIVPSSNRRCERRRSLLHL